MSTHKNARLAPYGRGGLVRRVLEGGAHTGMTRTPGVGREYLNVTVDGHFRIRFVSLRLDQTTRSAVAFLLAAMACYRNLGVIVKGVMTDNGPCHPSRGFREICAMRSIRHIRTRPYTERAYATAYQTSQERRDRLAAWIYCSWHRSRGSSKNQVPVSRLGVSDNSLAALHKASSRTILHTLPLHSCSKVVIYSPRCGRFAARAAP